jgi:hypothetical protein
MNFIIDGDYTHTDEEEEDIEFVEDEDALPSFEPDDEDFEPTII